MSKYIIILILTCFPVIVFGQTNYGLLVEVDSVMKRTENYKLSGLNSNAATWSMVQFGIGIPSKFKSNNYSAEKNYTLFRLVTEAKKNISNNFAWIYGNSYEYMSCPLPIAMNESSFLNDREWDSKTYRTNKLGITLGFRNSFIKRGANQHFSIDLLNTVEFNIAQNVTAKQKLENEKITWTEKKLEGRRVIEIWPTLRFMYNIYGFGVKYQALSQFKSGPYSTENFGHWRVFLCISIPT